MSRYDLHIEELLIDGVPGIDPAALRAAVQQELERILSDGGESPARDLAIPSVRIDLPPAVPVETIGARVAGAVHRRMTAS